MKYLIKDKNNIVEGKLWKTFILYFLPILLSSLIQQSYSVIDALIIGNFAGKSALAAIDAPLAYIRLLINTFIALSSGGSIIISQLYGKKEWLDLKKTASIIVNFSAFGGIVLTILGIILAPKFINLMLVPDDIYNLSLSYLRVYFSGTIFVFLFNIISGILRAMGDSRSPLTYLTISSVLNIFLDLFFVAYFKMGTAGAALATVISQGIATILIFLKFINNKDVYNFNSFREKKDYILFKSALVLGIPMALQAIIFSLANMFMQRGINSFGTIGIAGWSICGKSDFLIWNIADALGISVTTFVAQNYGAKKLQRAKDSLKYGFSFGSFIFILISILLYIFIDVLAKLFTRDIETIEMTIFLMRTIAPFYIFYMFSEIFGGAIRGMGNTFYPMLLSLIGVCFFRISWIVFILPKYNNLKTVIIGYPLSWILTAILHILYYFYFKRNIKNIN